MNLSLTFEILYLWKMLQKWSQIYFQKIHHATKWLLFSLSIIFGSIVCPVCGESTDCTFHYIYIYIYIYVYIYIIYNISNIIYMIYIYSIILLLILFFSKPYSMRSVYSPFKTREGKCESCTTSKPWLLQTGYWH